MKRKKGNQLGRLVFHYQKRKRKRAHLLLWALGAVLILAAYVHWQRLDVQSPKPVSADHPTPLTKSAPAAPSAGDVVAVDSVQSFNVLQTQDLAKENYGAATLPVNTGITKITFQYRSQLPSGQFATITARAYLPDAPKDHLPIFGFAPGTTGIGNECGASFENVAKANWGNYDSHMAMYASQGFAAVTTDYEDMKNPNYMVGQLEGRAVLDSIRALEQLPEAKGRLNTSQVFLGGYSQGGHAAFWADKLASYYSPSIKPLGVVGWGPVMSVSETMTDVLHGANINWFGPYVLYSYGSYYDQTFPGVVLPHWEATLDKDVPAHCIDSDIEFWGHIPANVYSSQFLQAAQNGTLDSEFPALAADMNANAVGSDNTSSAKLINSGQFDNVVLPQQEEAAAQTLCNSSTGPVQLNFIPGATHYDAMVKTVHTVISWMHTLMDGGKVTSTCPPPPLLKAPTPTPIPSNTPKP
jgi:hypothetical protein